MCYWQLCRTQCITVPVSPLVAIWLVNICYSFFYNFKLTFNNAKPIWCFSLSGCATILSEIWFLFVKLHTYLPYFWSYLCSWCIFIRILVQIICWKLYRHWLFSYNVSLCSRCPFLHRTAGDTERRYHLRYYKTGSCIHETDSKGNCSKNGSHCAFAHGSHDLRSPVYDIRYLKESELDMYLFSPAWLFPWAVFVRFSFLFHGFYREVQVMDSQGGSGSSEGGGGGDSQSGQAASTALIEKILSEEPRWQGKHRVMFLLKYISFLSKMRWNEFKNNSFLYVYSKTLLDRGLHLSALSLSALSSLTLCVSQYIDKIFILFYCVLDMQYTWWCMFWVPLIRNVFLCVFWFFR